MKNWKGMVAVLLLTGLVFLLGLTREGFRSWVLTSGKSPETRGLALSEKYGCLHCHGAWGKGGVPNPGVKEVPSLDDFSFMMAISDEFELREWILDGASERARKRPGFEESKKDRAVVMPAYRDRLSDNELEDLLAWYHAIACTIYPKDAKAVEGYKVSKQLGCFSCHGPGGRFDLPNPGSLAGYIPSWHSKDFHELARDEDEIREWILDGSCKRLREHKIARFFLDRQTVVMPAYRDKISEDQLEAILAYIRWLRNPEESGHRPDFQEDEGLEFDY